MRQLQIDEMYMRALYSNVGKVLITGSRTATRAHLGLIRDEMTKFGRNTLVIHGGQGKFGSHGICISGVDMLANEIAVDLGLNTLICPANWSAFQHRAGPIRNAEMVAMRPGLVLAFWDGVSTGTSGCMALARKAGIPVRVVEFDPLS